MIGALAVTIAISFNAPAGLDCGPGSSTVTAEGVEPVRGSWQPATVLELDRGREWLVETQSARCWTPPLTVAAGASAATVPVWPKRVLRGRLLLPRNARVPAAIELRVASPPRAEPPPVPESVVRCPVAASRFACDVPAVPLDVRLFAEGFAPHYAWDVSQDLGELRLITGALISGRASVPSDGSQAGISVELRPSSFAWSPHDLKRESAQSRQTKTNTRGFFSFSNVSPGEYVVKATKEGWSATEYRVHVAGGTSEAVVGKDLVLPELGRLEIVVTPPVDAQQRPWRVKLDRRVNNESLPVAEGETDPNGVWTYHGAESGGYAVVVLDGTGARVSADGVIVTGGPTTIPIRIEQVMIRGAVTLVGEPVPARGRFNDGYGKIATFSTDDEGRLSAMLPKEGKWDVEIWPRRGGAEVTLNDVEVRRSKVTGYADVDLELPAGRVRGVVVDAAGKPVEGHISIKRGAKYVASGKTATDGTFNLIGVPPGEVTLLATTQNREESELIRHRVNDDASVRIVVRKKRQFRGRLVTADGRPIAGARVHHRNAWRFWRELTTGPAGELSFAASPTNPHVELIIDAPGMPAKFAAVPVEEGREIDIAFAPVPGLLTIRRSTDRWPALTLGTNNDMWSGINAWLAKPWEPESTTARLLPDSIQILVEPGDYTVCNQKRTKCETVRVAAGARESIDARGWEE